MSVNNLNTISNHEGLDDKAGTFNTNDNLGPAANESHENNQHLDTHEKEVAFSVDYEISPENTKRFDYYRNDDLEVAIEAFSKENNLNQEQMDSFKALVHSKINSS